MSRATWGVAAVVILCVVVLATALSIMQANVSNCEGIVRSFEDARKASPDLPDLFSSFTPPYTRNYIWSSDDEARGASMTCDSSGQFGGLVMSLIFEAKNEDKTIATFESAALSLGSAVARDVDLSTVIRDTVSSYHQPPAQIGLGHEGKSQSLVHGGAFEVTVDLAGPVSGVSDQGLFSLNIHTPR